MQRRGTGPRPHTWVSGPDPITHQQYRVWIQARNQANFRNEPWSLTFNEFQELWQGNWNQRGRTRGSLCMTRDNFKESWSKENTILVTREAHAIRQAKVTAAKRNASSQ